MIEDVCDWHKAYIQRALIYVAFGAQRTLRNWAITSAYGPSTTFVLDITVSDGSASVDMYQISQSPLRLSCVDKGRL